MMYLNSDRVSGTANGKMPTYNRSQSGYGSKIPTSWKVQLDGKKWRRVYAICYSNCGSAYIVEKGKPVYLGAWEPSDFANEV